MLGLELHLFTIREILETISPAFFFFCEQNNGHTAASCYFLTWRLPTVFHLLCFPHLARISIIPNVYLSLAMIRFIFQTERIARNDVKASTNLREQLPLEA